MVFFTYVPLIFVQAVCAPVRMIINVLYFQPVDYIFKEKSTQGTKFT